MNLRCGMRMSFNEVRRPHIKNSAVAMLMARTSVLEVLVLKLGEEIGAEIAMVDIFLYSSERGSCGVSVRFYAESERLGQFLVVPLIRWDVSSATPTLGSKTIHPLNRACH